MLVFERNIVTRFFQNASCYARGKLKKSVFSIERHYNVGSKMMQN